MMKRNVSWPAGMSRPLSGCAGRATARRSHPQRPGEIAQAIVRTLTRLGDLVFKEARRSGMRDRSANLAHTYGSASYSIFSIISRATL